MWKKVILIILILISYTIICHKIYYKYEETNNYSVSINKMESKPHFVEMPIGKLIIKKINLTNNLYDINSPKNNIEENVTILKGSTLPDVDNTTIILAAHSGPDKIAYFNNLNKLAINDEIKLLYKNKIYIYIIKDIWEVKKNGEIIFPKESTNQLVLTTCSTTNKENQLIINSVIKKGSNLK